jgi:hypothetical protein
MVDLNAWHTALHRITGSMALAWTRVSAGDLRGWAETLRGIADEMDVASLNAPHVRKPKHD